MGKIPLGFEVVSFLVIGFISRLLWESWMSGRVKKEAPYVTTKDCATTREKCCISGTKKDVATLDTRVVANEKRLDQGRESFKELRDAVMVIKSNVSGIKSDISGIRSTLVFIEDIIKNIKT